MAELLLKRMYAACSFSAVKVEKLLPILNNMSEKVVIPVQTNGKQSFNWVYYGR